MFNVKKNIIGGLIALSVGGMALVANADASHGPADGHRGPPSAEMVAKFQARVAKHQQELHDKLKLTAAQEPAWNAFIARTAPPQRPEDMKRPDRREEARLPTPERLEHQLARLQGAEKFLTARLEAVKSFYAVLTPEQQKVFDAAHRHGGFGHGDHRGFWHHDRADGPDRHDNPDNRGPVGKPAAPQ